MTLKDKEDSIEQPQRSRIFISCGQRHGTDEVQIAKEIELILRNAGFDPYVGAEEQTLRGITENVFQQLQTSEYFIFIDFKREYVPDLNAHRGSLFSHQELALATFLGLPIIAFCEKDVVKEDGIMKFLQGNSYEFSDRHFLKDVIINRVKERGWVPYRQNELILNRDAAQFVDAVDANLGQIRVFHVKVTNRHKHKSAIGCYVYLEKVVNTLTSNTIFQGTVEVKWTGYKFPMANIVPDSCRFFDALIVTFNQMSQAQIHTITDYSNYSPVLSGPGDYILQFLVLAENFSPARISLQLHMGVTIDDASLVVLA